MVVAMLPMGAITASAEVSDPVSDTGSLTETETATEEGSMNLLGMENLFTDVSLQSVTEYVYSVNSEADLRTAITNAPTDGSATTIQLGNSFTVSSFLNIEDKNIILDLNGKNLSCSGPLLRLEGETHLEVKDTSAGKDGVLSSSSGNTIYYLEDGTGTVTISSGTVTSVSSTPGTAIRNEGNGDITISGGTVSSTTGSAIWNEGDGHLIVSGGTVTTNSNQDTIINYAGNVTISGGTVTATAGTALSSSGNVTISGGTIISSSQISVYNLIGTGTVNITGGTLGLVYIKELNLSGNPTLTVALNFLTDHKFSITGPLMGDDGSITLNGTSLSPTGTHIVATADNEAHAVLSKFSLINVDGKTLTKSGANIVLSEVITGPWSHGIAATTTTWDEGGIITTAQELAQFAYNVNNWKNYSGKTITLGNDIDLSGREWTPIGNIHSQFTGIFDGNGKKIAGLQINSVANTSGLQHVGLFGNVFPYGIIKNLGVEGEIVSNRQGYDSAAIYVGGLAGSLNGSTIENCYSKVTVRSNEGSYVFIGGLVGDSRSSTIINSSVTGTVTGVDYSRIGGLVGLASTTNITNSYATGNVTGGAYVTIGGLIGYNTGSYGATTITNSYATGNVTGGDSANVGGLVGENSITSTITNSYATGNVTGGDSAYIGGLVGRKDSTGSLTITNSYWNNSADQIVNGGAQTPKIVIGRFDGSLTNNALGMTSAAMKEAAFVTTLNSNLNDLANPALFLWQTRAGDYPTHSSTLWSVPTTITKAITIGTAAPVRDAAIANGTNTPPTGATGPVVTWSADNGANYVAASGNFAAETAYKTKYVYTANEDYAFDSTITVSDITVTHLGGGTKTVALSGDNQTLTVTVTWPSTGMPSNTTVEVNTREQLYAAIEGAPADGTYTTIKLTGQISNASDTEKEITDKNIIIDLNGFSIQNNFNVLLKGTTNLEVKDTSSQGSGIWYYSSAHYVLSNEGTGSVTISGGEVRSRSSVVRNFSTGSVNVTGGKITAEDYHFPIANYGTGDINVTGGLVTSTHWGNLQILSQSSSGGSINVWGGTITGGISANYTSNISGGTIGKVTYARLLSLSGNPTLTVNLNTLTDKKFTITGPLTEGASIILDGNNLALTDEDTIIATADNEAYIDVTKFSLINISGKNLIKVGANLVLSNTSTPPTNIIAKAITIGTAAPVSDAAIANGTNTPPTGATGPVVTWSADNGATYVAASGNFAAETAYKTKYVYTANEGYAFDSTITVSDITVTNLGGGTKTVALSDSNQTLTITVTWPATGVADSSSQLPDTSHYAAMVAQDNVITGYDTFAEAWSAIQAVQPATIKLYRDVTSSSNAPAAWPMEISTGKYITIDLNGHTINRGLTAPTTNGNIFRIGAGNLTIQDSSSTDVT